MSGKEEAQQKDALQGRFHKRLSDLPRDEWPQERMEKLGPEALTKVELLAILLRSGGKGYDVLQMAATLLERSGDLSGMIGWKAGDFEAIPGIGRVKALQLAAAFQLARRAMMEMPDLSRHLDDPEKVFAYMEAFTIGLETERFWVLGLNRKNRLIRCEEITVGTATSSLAHPREIFREAIRQGASGLVVAHNHPSGDPAPSKADLEVTRRLREASKVLGIDLMDHVIVGHRGADPHKLGYYSFADAGLL